MYKSNEATSAHQCVKLRILGWIGFPLHTGRLGAQEDGQSPKKVNAVLWTVFLLLAGITAGLIIAVRLPKARDANELTTLKDRFFQACKDNGVPVTTGQQVLDVCLSTPKPGTPFPCEKWTKAVVEKLPPRTAADFIKSTVRPGPGGKGITGVLVGEATWGFDPCPANLWCVIADAHFAIRVKFPDGQQFFFDDGDWGRIFEPGEIPAYAR